MNPLTFRDPAHFEAPVNGGPVGALALLSTGAASDTGIAIDKRAISTGKQFQGVAVYLPVEVTTLTSGLFQTVQLTLQHSDASSSGWATFLTGTAVNVGLEGSTSSGTVRGVASVTGNLLSAKRWLRPKVTFTGSASDTGVDTSASAFVVLGVGPNEAPA